MCMIYLGRGSPAGAAAGALGGGGLAPGLVTVVGTAPPPIKALFAASAKAALGPKVGWPPVSIKGPLWPGSTFQRLPRVTAEV